MPKKTISRSAAALKSALSADKLDALGLQTGQSQRLRVVTPSRLALTILAAFGSGSVESIADLLREFNFRYGTNTAYKAFYNRLAHDGFAVFMKALVGHLLSEFAVRTLGPSAGAAIEDFEDIVIQDGSSFVVKESLRSAFPGRFKNVEPAAVELHATFSGFLDEVTDVTLTADKEGERQFLPKAEALEGKLLLADRGYPSLAYFLELCDANASFVMRLSRTYKPWVTAVHHANAVERPAQPLGLAEFIASRPRGVPMDIDVEFRRAPGKTFRLVLMPGKDKWMTRLCTNMPRERFPLALVAQLYRFRWQIELVFKEWKSYANLHRFDTGNAHIAEGFIWASLAAAVLKRFIAHTAQATTEVAISTRKVAMCAQIFLRDLCSAVGASLRRLTTVLRGIVRFLEGNATRANPQKEQRVGRLSVGLVPVHVS